MEILDMRSSPGLWPIEGLHLTPENVAKIHGYNHLFSIAGHVAVVMWRR